MKARNVNPDDLNEVAQADRERHLCHRPWGDYEHNKPTSKALREVMILKRFHQNTWCGKSNGWWALCLAEEFMELILALLGLHRHSPDLELIEIASIAINWLEMREEEGWILDDVIRTT